LKGLNGESVDLLIGLKQYMNKYSMLIFDILRRVDTRHTHHHRHNTRWHNTRKTKIEHTNNNDMEYISDFTKSVYMLHKWSMVWVCSLSKHVE